MHVRMFNSLAGRPSIVYSNVETARLEAVKQKASRLAHQCPNCQLLIEFKLKDAANVSAGHDKDVPLGYWKRIRDRDSVLIFQEDSLEIDAAETA
jgi:hypothetical protein